MRKFGFPLFLALMVVIWGCVTGWWNMAGMTLALIAIITAFVGTKGKNRKYMIIVLAMLPVIGKKVQALKQFQKEAEEKVIEAVKAEEDFVLFLNTRQQLWKGQDGDGQRITPLYKPFTIRVKLAKGQPVNRVTLRDTGDFWDGMMVLYGQDDFRIINRDEKAPKLRAKYGANILGLNEENRDHLAQKIKPVLQNNFKKAVNG